MRKDLHQLLVVNWPIKMTALALATVLWAAVAAQEPTTQLVPVVLRIEPPAGRALAQQPPRVQALFSGTSREIFKLYADPPLVRKVIPETRAASFTVELSPQDITVTTDAAVQVQDIQPRQIEVLLDAVGRRWVPVDVRVVVFPDPGFELIGSVRAAPESVLVVGPETQVRDIESVPTITDTLFGVRESLERPLQLDTTGLRVVTPTQHEVTLVADITEITQRVLSNIPVTITSGGDRWVLAAPSVLVTVEGPSTRIERLTADSVAVSVRPMGSADSTMVKLNVRGPLGISSWATPDSMLVRRRERA